MGTTQKELLLLQIGPVQDFIAAARTTEDFWSGSYMIAYLAAAGIRHVKAAAGIRHVKEECGGKIIFPFLDNQKIYQRLLRGEGELGQPTLPNRFLAEVPHEMARKIAVGAAAAIRQELEKISSACFAEFCKLFPKSGARYEARWNDQVNRFLQITWQTIPLTSSTWGKDYGRLLANLAARRNTRDFEQILNDGEQNEFCKDALNGKDEIVGDVEEWKTVCRSPNDFFGKEDRPYGAMSIIKRMWCRTCLGSKLRKKTVWDLRNPKGEAENYIAAIQMDGDHMGQILSSKGKDGEFFTRFSRLLANFTSGKAEEIVKQHGGELIYAGGDDVLALVPAWRAVDCALALQKQFSSDDPDMPGSEKNLAEGVSRVTLSAGIAFCHYKTPLTWLLEEARRAEHRAKEGYGRNALALSIVKRSGETLLWGAKFDSKAWELYRRFVELSRREILTGRFTHALAGILAEYRLEELPKELPPKLRDALSDIIRTDFDVVCTRQKAKGKEKDEGEELKGFIELAQAYIGELCGKDDTGKSGEKDKLSLAEFPKLFLSADFLIRKGEGK